MKAAVCVGCGIEFVVRADRRGLYCTAGCANRSKAGADHPNYKGGLSRDKASGRWKIMCRDGSQMWFYRGVMAAHLGRLLTEEELVHHVNEDPSDDRIENLRLTTRVEHPTLHAHA